jgi:protein-tyrosine phosphatase
MSFDRGLDESSRFRICFVCTGNICRSPMAEVVFTNFVRKAKLADAIDVSSAGTGDWHVGERSDDRTLQALRARGYDGEAHRARQFDTDWFDRLDLIVVFDHSQERILRSWANNDLDRSKIQPLLGFDSEVPRESLDVPDPYYSDAAMFDQVLSTIERACAALFSQVITGIHGGVS